MNAVSDALVLNVTAMKWWYNMLNSIRFFPNFFILRTSSHLCMTIAVVQVFPLKKYRPTLLAILSIIVESSACNRI